jgi:hypothetical protein
MGPLGYGLVRGAGSQAVSCSRIRTMVVKKVVTVESWCGATVADVSGVVRAQEGAGVVDCGCGIQLFVPNR